MDEDWKAIRQKRLLNFIMMIYLMLITCLWNFIAGSLNGMGTKVKAW